ncbi:hypothetical protein [Oceanobacillus kimchii]|uniref:hypothetical protein n=1 Tax=Oceanobacillus kimchii TaxID=746691 RepID=UPI003B01510B
MKENLKVLWRLSKYELFYLYHEKRLKNILAKETTKERMSKAKYHLEKLEEYHEKIYQIKPRGY